MFLDQKNEYAYIRQCPCCLNSPSVYLLYKDLISYFYPKLISKYLESLIHPLLSFLHLFSHLLIFYSGLDLCLVLFLNSILIEVNLLYFNLILNQFVSNCLLNYEFPIVFHLLLIYDCL